MPLDEDLFELEYVTGGLQLPAWGTSPNETFVQVSVLNVGNTRAVVRAFGLRGLSFGPTPAEQVFDSDVDTDLNFPFTGTSTRATSGFTHGLSLAMANKRRSTTGTGSESSLRPRTLFRGSKSSLRTADAEPECRGSRILVWLPGIAPATFRPFSDEPGSLSRRARFAPSKSETFHALDMRGWFDSLSSAEFHSQRTA